MTSGGKEGALVIGAGFIGRRVAGQFLQAGVATQILTRSPVTEGAAQVRTGRESARILIGDAADPVVLIEALRGARHVVYCAGGLMPADSTEAPLTDAALTLPPLICVLEALRQRPEVDLTFLSSGGTVYGIPNRLPVAEEHATDPLCPYGVLKLAAEKYIGLYAHLYGVRGRILRCSNVYGEGQPHDRGQGVVAAWLHQILRNQPITIFGDGSVVRDYLYLQDLAALVVNLAGRSGGPAVMNVGSGEATSLLDLLSCIREVTRCPVEVRHLPARKVDVPRITLDITRLRRFTGFRPSPLGAGLQRTWAAVQAAHNKAPLAR